MIHLTRLQQTPGSPYYEVGYPDATFPEAMEANTALRHARRTFDAWVTRPGAVPDAKGLLRTCLGVEASMPASGAYPLTIPYLSDAEAGPLATAMRRRGLGV